jgi:hypothetical protein
MRNFIFVIFILLLGCAEAKNNYLKRICHYDGAFEEGTNDAQNGYQMRGEKHAQECPDRVKADVRKGYREGYTTAKTNSPNAAMIKNSKSHRTSRSFMTKSCIENFGKQVCGYGCIESFGTAKCARHPGNNCIDEYGQIVCGQNCKDEGSQIHCDYRE